MLDKPCRAHSRKAARHGGEATPLSRADGYAGTLGTLLNVETEVLHRFASSVKVVASHVCTVDCGPGDMREASSAYIDRVAVVFKVRPSDRTDAVGY